MPEYTDYETPLGNPLLPNTFDTFNPDFGVASPATGACEIAEFTRSAAPGDSLAISASGMSNYVGNDSAKDTEFMAYGQTSVEDSFLGPPKIHRIDDQLAAISLPATLPVNSAYLLWAGNDNGFSAPVMINKAEAWWVGPDQTSAGHTISIYGRNLSHNKGTTDSWVWIEDSLGNGQWATVTSVNPYKVDISVPSGLDNGDYSVWMHNGHGGTYGWSDPLTLTVQDEFSYSEYTINATDYGADGMDSDDDFDAISLALYNAAGLRCVPIYRSGSIGTLVRYVYTASDSTSDLILNRVNNNPIVSAITVKEVSSQSDSFSISHFTGGDPGEGLSLSGNYDYAVDMSLNSDTVLQGITFTRYSAVSGLSVQANRYTASANYGSTADDNALEKLMATQVFPKGSNPDQTIIQYNVTQGKTYELQLLLCGGDVGANVRRLDITLDGARPSDSGTLVFPAGTFYISDEIYIPDSVQVIGAGMDETSLTMMSTHSGDSVLRGDYPNQNITVKNLTLDANNALGTGYPGVIDMNSSNTVFEGVRIKNLLGQSGTLHLFANRTKFLDCEVIGRGFIMYGNDRVSFDHVDFYGVNAGISLIHSWGGGKISVTNCTAQDYGNTATESFLGRFFTGAGYRGSVEYIYLGENIANNLGPHEDHINANSGEAFMFEGFDFDHLGAPTSSTSTTVTINGLTTEKIGSLGRNRRMVVANGKGMGQTRTVIDFDETTDTVTLDKPWRVIPDSTSELTILGAADHVAIYNNQLDAKDRCYTSPSHIASTAFQPFEGSSNWIVDGNSVTDYRYGIAIFAGINSSHEVGTNISRPNVFGLYENNNFTNARWGIKMHDHRSNYGPGMLGNVFRNNSFSNVIEQGIQIVRAYETVSPCMDMNVFEKNVFINTAEAIYVDSKFQSTNDGQINNTVFYSNSFDGTSTGVAYYNELTEDGNPAFRNNSWSQYLTTYSGTLPDAIPELPQRVIRLTVGEGNQTSTQFSIRNAGTSSLNWTLIDDASWLIPSASSGTVYDEASSSDLLITADASSLGIGEYTANVAVSGNSQTVKATVILSVVSQNLIGHWKLDNNLTDSAGSNNGTMFGSGSTYASSIDGEGLELTGNQHVTYGDILDPDSGSQTIMLWFNWDGATGGRFLASKGGQQNSLDGWSMMLNAEEKIVLRVMDGNGHLAVQLSPEIAENEWHHIAMVIDREGKVVNGYLNGSNDGWASSGQGIYDNSLVDFGAINTDSPLALAASYNGSSSFVYPMRFPGLVDDYRVYNRALSAGEIDYIYNSMSTASGMLNHAQETSLTTQITRRRADLKETVGQSTRATGPYDHTMINSTDISGQDPRKSAFVQLDDEVRPKQSPRAYSTSNNTDTRNNLERSDTKLKITSVIPSSVDNFGMAIVEINGANFDSGVEIILIRDEWPNTLNATVYHQDSHQVFAAFELSHDEVSPGTYDIRVRNQNGDSFTFRKSLTIIDWDD
ncbi:LamG-like jellyroll fold domain-containing protein [Puniceicoccus vermicola]|uniref:Uncharacterized protein n=1 Tax=Puniceicoccus vermicola TaxID=388746 RepID=A0A7X1B078_9BACT|nr:hypothetical protein [Puniceicoccus vermicola]